MAKYELIAKGRNIVSKVVETYDCHLYEIDKELLQYNHFEYLNKLIQEGKITSEYNELYISSKKGRYECIFGNEILKKCVNEVQIRGGHPRINSNVEVVNEFFIDFLRQFNQTETSLFLEYLYEHRESQNQYQETYFTNTFTSNLLRYYQLRMKNNAMQLNSSEEMTEMRHLEHEIKDKFYNYNMLRAYIVACERYNKEKNKFKNWNRIKKTPSNIQKEEPKVVIPKEISEETLKRYETEYNKQREISNHQSYINDNGDEKEEFLEDSEYEEAYYGKK